VNEEDPEKRRLRQLAETAGSLAPARIGAWTTPGHVAGESWSEMPWLGRAAFVILFVMLAAAYVLLVVAVFRAGQVVEAVFLAAFAALLACVFTFKHARRQRSARSDRSDDEPHDD
jgi:hypothetical protein